MRLYLERLCQDHVECGNVSLKAVILANDNISHIIIKNIALAEYLQVEMVLGALTSDLRAKLVMKLEQHPRDPSTVKYNNLQRHVVDNCATPDTLIFMDVEVAYMAPGVSSSSIPAGVPLPLIPVVVELPAIPNNEILAPGQVTEVISITKAEINRHGNGHYDEVLRGLDLSAAQSEWA
jgi:hypothetical protein